MTIHQQASGRRRWIVVVAVLVALIIAVGIVLIVRSPAPPAGGPDESPTSADQTADPSTSSPDPADPTDPPATSTPTDPPGTSTPTDPPGTSTPTDPGVVRPAPQVTTDGPLDDESAMELVDSYISTAAGLTSDTRNVSAQVDAVADDMIIAELEADLRELDSQGWTRTGEPIVESVVVLEQDDDATPPTATVEACIDSSSVQLLDADGAPLPSDPDAARARHLFSLTQKDDGSWIIVARSFPSDPSC